MRVKHRLSIRRSLVLNLVGVILLLSGAILLTMVLGARSAIRSLSAVVIAQIMDKTEGELRRFFDPVTRDLLETKMLAERGMLDIEDAEDLRRQLAPIMQQYDQITSSIVADEAGREFMMLRTGARWLIRQTGTAGTNGRSRIRRWTEGEETVAETLEALDYDPRVRPWYIGATEKWRTWSTSVPRPALSESISWTGPYKFFTTGDVGITASVRCRTDAGPEALIAFDVMLKDVQKYADQIEILENGRIVILTMEYPRRIIGFSLRRHFGDQRSADSILLRSPEDLKIGLLEDAGIALRDRDQEGRAEGEPLRIMSEGRAWWGTGRRFALASDKEFLMMVLVPESDLLGRLQQRRIWVLGITAVALVLGIGRALVLAHRYSRPIESLVAASDRISQGDLQPGAPIESHVSEIVRLADAHERMRQGLVTLMKLERDLQLARQIQQQTLPLRLPEVAGFEMAAWNEPAEETGGDTYDVVGYGAGEGTEAVHVSWDAADRAVMLLADATGHGIGPALSVLQLRAMLRMAIHIHPDLQLIIRHMNEQLCMDLPEGRFVTAWLGQISAADHRLTWFSAGQAPLLHYIAADQTVRPLPATTVPLGLFDDMDTDGVTSMELQPGDIFAVISDGVFEATSPKDEQFGTDRVGAIIRTGAGESASQIVAAIRASLSDFTGSAPPEDDRTIVLIKRV